MGLFTKKTTFKDITVQCLIDWSDQIYGDKEELTVSAQKEGTYRLSREQTDTLWTNLEYFYLTVVYLSANQEAQGAKKPAEIGAVVTEVYLSYLVHQKNMSQNDARALIENNYVNFSESIIEDAVAGAQRRADQEGEKLSYSEILNVASKLFCTHYAYVDNSTQVQIKSDSGDTYSDGMFDSERVAFKLVRATLAVVRERFQNNKISW